MTNVWSAKKTCPRLCLDDGRQNDCEIEVKVQPLSNERLFYLAILDTSPSAIAVGKLTLR